VPFKIKWPFRWPWQRRSAKAEGETEGDSGGTVTPSQPAEATSTSRPGGALVFRAGVEDEASLEPPRGLEAGGGGFELGSELLSRLPMLSTPPTLGRQGGLPAMAQTLPAVERFMQRLPAPPVQRLLEGALTRADEFAANLPALASFGGAGPSAGAPAFPDQLASTEAPTDVLPPLGSLPGQAPSISGQAPVITPQGPARREIVRIITERVSAETRADEAQERPAPLAAPRPAPLAPETAAQPSQWPMTQVLPVEQTLAGNILPAPEGAPILRALEPGTPAGLGELVEPGISAGERVTPQQREAIERQRGQGTPLAPEVRQHFEQSFGQSLADVRIHTGQAAHQTAESLNAIAFASGADLFFTQNTFRPDSEQGLGLIGHELAHVVQQQYGVPGDADALRPADDGLERQADRMAAQALDTPLAVPEAEAPTGAPVQRAIVGTLPNLGAETAIQPAWQTGASLERGPAVSAADRPLGLGPMSEEPEPVQRFSLGNISELARNAAPQVPSLPENVPTDIPELGSVAERVGGLTDQLPDAGALLGRVGQIPSSIPALGGLAQNLPSLDRMGGMLPALQGGLPALGNLPSSLGGLTDMLPAVQNALPAVQSALGGLGGMTGGLPSLGGLAQNLPGGLTDVLPAVQGGLPDLGQLPSLGGMQLPDMPLAEGLGGLGQAMGGAAAAGQEALGSITSMGPSAPEMPAAPPLPSLEKLTEHVWKQVQQKLKVERERARGLA